MTEVESIKDALVNVITLATNSDYYNKYRDDQDIYLIKVIVKKEIPKKPYFESDTWICPRCGHNYKTEFDHYNYCQHCGKRIDWSEEE